ncbi:TIGR00730 family Rossman fold protein [Hymenobacter sp. BT683]|uniref:Cytokinin riboside 5'-monophosphate phosphoribohydrolase n=1 Tax=Hymenobacter jeongseonensis TaxID=2791027 RepID=A0ABS0IG58_9BACT|nr:TIGR00730 family Rossman fold protein [Hymenobacter jeongseonensis]MBF9237147.1 TIGR00730 family Rossman fold protein [Hymenobacter jeongseonensis]
MKSIAVYCGSSAGTNPLYVAQAQALGAAMVANDLTLVYGGGRVGLMGTIADAVLAHGGKVIGVIPDFLANKELAHLGCTELHVVKSMHERKLLMADRADAFVAMPGGYGTLEELFEVLTWGQLGLHSKPVAVLNVDGYYDHLLLALDRMRDDQLLRSENRAQLLQSADPEELLAQLVAYQPVQLEKWLTPPTT